MAELFRRQTAYKLWINDLIVNELVKDEDNQSRAYLNFMDKKISRINVVATVVQVLKNNEKQYAFLTIDDSSGQIRVKTWSESIQLLDNINIGDTILLIGRIREYNNEIYIVPEIVKKVNALWEIERRLELSKDTENGIEKQKITEIQIKNSEKYIGDNAALVTEEKVQAPPETLKGKIINLIEKLDKEDGADIIEVINQSNLEKSKVDKVIEDLIKQGEIYQIGPNKLKTT